MSAVDAPAVREQTSRARRAGGWIAIGAVVLVVGGIGALFSGIGDWTGRDTLDPESPAPWGARALAEVLRDQGVDVVVARDRGDALEALGQGPATLVLPDTPALSDDGLTTLADAAADVVLINPRASTLDLLLPGAEPFGVADDTPVAPECDLGDANRAGAIGPGAVFAATDTDLIACYPSAGGFALLVEDDGTRRVSAIDGTAVFVNEHLADAGNAALGVNLLGRHATVVWYMPGVGDTDLTDGAPSLGELTPPWVSPAIVLLLGAGVAAAIWRGRRFGPLVAERLPVTVRAAETTEGRGRLYAQARDRVHASDQLRIGALVRIGRMLGLSTAASAHEISDAAAARVGADRAMVRGILIDDLPANDADLVSLHRRLRDLETAVRTAVHPERNTR